MDHTLYRWDDYKKIITDLDASEYVSSAYRIQDLFYMLYLYYKNKNQPITHDMSGGWQFIFKLDNSKHLKISEYSSVVYVGIIYDSIEEKERDPMQPHMVKDAAIQALAMVSQFVDDKYNGMASSMFLMSSMSGQNSIIHETAKKYFADMRRFK